MSQFLSSMENTRKPTKQKDFFAEEKKQKTKSKDTVKTEKKKKKLQDMIRTLEKVQDEEKIGNLYRDLQQNASAALSLCKDELMSLLEKHFHSDSQNVRNFAIEFQHKNNIEPPVVMSDLESEEEEKDEKYAQIMIENQKLLDRILMGQDDSLKEKQLMDLDKNMFCLEDLIAIELNFIQIYEKRKDSESLAYVYLNIARMAGNEPSTFSMLVSFIESLVPIIMLDDNIFNYFLVNLSEINEELMFLVNIYVKMENITKILDRDYRTDISEEVDDIIQYTRNVKLKLEIPEKTSEIVQKLGESKESLLSLLRTENGKTVAVPRAKYLVRLIYGISKIISAGVMCSIKLYAEPKSFIKFFENCYNYKRSEKEQEVSKLDKNIENFLLIHTLLTNFMEETKSLFYTTGFVPYMENKGNSEEFMYKIVESITTSRWEYACKLLGMLFEVPESWKKKIREISYTLAYEMMGKHIAGIIFKQIK